MSTGNRRTPPEHGTVARYKHRKSPCRCVECKEAKRLDEARGRRLRGIQPRNSGLTHGTLSGYKNHKCRCDNCKEANNNYQKEYFARRRSADELLDPVI